MERSVHAKRIDTYAMRFMSLLAVNELKTEIDIDIVQKVCKLMRWQLAVRKEYDPVDCDNKMAGMEEKIRRALLNGPLSESKLKRAVHYSRLGLWFYNKAVGNLQGSKEIVYNKDSKLWSLRN